MGTYQHKFLVFLWRVWTNQKLALTINSRVQVLLNQMIDTTQVLSDDIHFSSVV